MNDGHLGIAVLFIYLATVLSTRVTGLSIQRVGSRLTTAFGGVAFLVMFPLISICPSFAILIPINFSFGFGMGLMDVAMNSCAILTEAVAEKPLLGNTL